MYNSKLPKLYKLLGTKGTTNSKQLLDIGRKIFGNDFVGTFPADIFVNEILPYMSSGQLAIVNTENNNEDGEHWVLFIKDNTDLLGYDSYGENIKKYNPNFKNLKIIQDMKDAEQKSIPIETNCGQRTLASAIIYKKYGRKAFLKI